MLMFKLVIRGREVDSYQNLEQALAELRALRASGEVDVALIRHDRGEACYSWCVGAKDIREYLQCIQKCDEEGLETVLPVHDDLSV